MSCFRLRGGVNNVLSAIWPVGAADGTDGLAEQLTSAIGPYLHYGILIGAVASCALICIVLAKVMLALHRTAAWKVMIAAVFAVVVTGILFGSVLPDGNFGWRPYIEINVRNSVGLAFGFRG